MDLRQWSLIQDPHDQRSGKGIAGSHRVDRGDSQGGLLVPLSIEKYR
jgi:hypothetical protein